MQSDPGPKSKKGRSKGVSREKLDKARTGSLPPRAEGLLSPQNKDVEKQAQLRVQNQPSLLANWVLIMNGIHIFCGVPILSMPYALREGGWLSLIALVLFAMFTYYTSLLLGICFENNKRLRTYADVGAAAYGEYGRLMFKLVEFILAYASSVESTIVVRDLLHPFFPDVLMYIGIKAISYGAFASYVILIVMFMASLLRDYDDWDQMLTFYGVGLTILSVLTLLWIFLVVGYIPEESSRVFVNVSRFPMAIGFYAYCYAGHPYLPQLYNSMIEKRSYIRVLSYIYGPSTILYALTAIMGYMMFGGDVESVYLLSFQKNLTSISFAIGFTVTHQVIRYILAVWPMARAIDELSVRLKLGDRARLSVSIVGRGLIVSSSILLSLVAPLYGPLMSFLGSLLGTLVALIIPCSCYLRLRRAHISRRQGIFIQTIIVVSYVAAILGALKSLGEMGEVLEP